MAEAEEHLRITLVGLMGVARPCGEQLTIKGLKARGLLALLLLAPDMARSRRWIEGHLWSASDPSHAGSSLRQQLRDLRKTLGPDADILVADRNEVRLRRERLWVDVLDAADTSRAALEDGQVLLEGLNIKDPVFSGWLAHMRQFHGAPKTPVTVADVPAVSQGETLAPHVVLSLSIEGSHAERALAQAIGRQVAQTAAETCPIEIASETGTCARLYRNSVLLSLIVVDKGREALVSFELSQPAQGRLLWSERVVTPVGGVAVLNDAGLIGLANQASEQITLHFADPERAARIAHETGSAMGATLKCHALVNSAVREMFSFDFERLRAADSLLHRSECDHGSAVVEAWLALLCVIRLVERECDDPEDMRARAVFHMQAALEGGEHNATVLGIVSQVISFLKLDDFDAFHFAERAVRLNRWNAMAKLAYGVAEIRRGRLREGYETCRVARIYADGLAHRHWWDMSFALAALARGKTEEAIEAAERALSFHPSFRPPIRHLYALYLHSGQYAKAGRILTRMRELEPEFSLRMVREDPDYPMVTIRQTPLGAMSDMS